MMGDAFVDIVEDLETMTRKEHETLARDFSKVCSSLLTIA